VKNPIVYKKIKNFEEEFVVTVFVKNIETFIFEILNSNFFDVFIFLSIELMIW